MILITTRISFDTHGESFDARGSVVSQPTRKPPVMLVAPRGYFSQHPHLETMVRAVWQLSVDSVTPPLDHLTRTHTGIAGMQDFINRQADATLAAPGETPMERLNARLNDASEA